MSKMSARKRIALVAHDNMKPALAAWAGRHRHILSQHDLLGTGTTGSVIAEQTGLEITRLASGPKGGDLQLGALITEGKLDVLIFFTDPLTAMPHDVDVKALLRISVLGGVALACNSTTADFIVGAADLSAEYEPGEGESCPI